MSNLMTAILAPLRKGEIVKATRSGEWASIEFNTPISINVNRPTLLRKIRAAIDILRKGYHDTEQQRVLLVLHHTYASELNDLLIENIYYTEDGEYTGERFTYQDSEPSPNP